MAEAAAATEQASCPTCGAASSLEQVGSASGRKHYRCPTCGPWRAKNPAATALGRLGGKASAEKLSPEAHQKRMTELAEKRWLDESLRRMFRRLRAARPVPYLLRQSL